MNSTNKKKWIAGASILGVIVGIILMQIQGLMGWGFLVAIVSLVLVLAFRKQLEGEPKAVEVKKEDVPKVGAGSWIGAVIVIGFLIWGVSSITTALTGGGNKEPVAEAPASYDDAEAYIFSKNVIEKILKAPSTADFPWMGEVTRQGDVIKVIAYVDAENSFGAKLRSPWSVLFRDNEGKAELLQVVLDGKEYYRDPEL